jgi:dTDP-4-dehydrorhamnose 3,5-epimerase-like enzyme
MSKVINIPTFSNNKGSLSVIESLLNFSIKRVYYIYNIRGIRGQHRHFKTIQFFVCLNGKVELIVKKKYKKKYILSKPNKGILLQPEDWHEFKSLKKDTVLLVLASHKFSEEDYIYEK